MESNEILITGGAGFIGTNLVKELENRGHEVLAVDLLHNERENYKRCDVRNYRQLERLFKDHEFDYVYHLAAEYGRWNGEEYYENLWQTNIIGTKHMIRLQEKLGFRMIFFSSAEVYGDYTGIMSEDVMVNNPIKDTYQMNDYAITKWAGELMCMNSATMFNTETVRVRPVNCYGPYEEYSPYKGFIPIFIYKALHNQPYTVYKGHKRIVDYVEDTVRTFANIVDNFIPGEVYNVGGRTEWEKDIKEYSDLVLEAVGRDDSLIKYEEAENFTTHVKTMDFSKAIKDLKHDPQVDPVEGIKKTVEWMQWFYKWKIKMDYTAYNEKTVLVTGGAGCVGSNLTSKLSDFADRVIIIDNLDSAYEWNIPPKDNIEFVKGDILDDEILSRVFKENPDYVFHLAAHFANQNSVENPELDLMVNGMGILKVLQYAQLIGVERFIYSSSGCGVYGLDSQMPFEEQDISISLHTPYQVTKLLGELYTNYFHNLYDLPIVNARFFNVFGPGEVPGKYRNVIPNFIYWAMTEQALPITGDGSETRDWTYVDDIVDGLMRMGIIKEAIGEAINLGSGEETRVIEMANMVNDLTGNTAGIAYASRRDWDAKTRLLSSIQKAKKILGYHPKVTFNEGLKKTYNWFQDNWDNIERCAEL